MAMRSPTINVMIKAAERAARSLLKDFGEVEQLQVSRKGPADFVSHADVRAQEIVVGELAKARPGYGLMVEEGGAVRAGDGHHRFIVDPLDGTTNFLHGLPQWAISIGLERDGELVAGVVSSPAMNELFWAEKGHGAYLDDRRADHRLRVSGRRGLPEALIGTGAPFLGRGDHDRFLAEMGLVMAQTAGIRRMGAAALDLAYVAAGRLDGFWERGLQAWDIAAGIVIVREAGGYVTDFAGRPPTLESGDVVAANDHLHAPLRQLLRKGG